MSTLPVNCNRCGSAVNVGPDTRYVTCSHCRTPLVVVRTATSVFTDRAARQKELERIDREWEEEKQQHHTWSDKNGGRRTNDELLEPAIIISGIVGLAFLGALLASIAHKSIELLLMALILVVPVAVWLAVTVRTTRRYWQAQARYRGRRFAAEQQPWNDNPG